MRRTLVATAVVLCLCTFHAAAVELRESPVNATAPRECYSCEGINCQRVAVQNATVTCQDLLDICVTVYEGFRVSERGCLLELSLAARAKCEARDPQCQKCEAQLCNNLGRVDFRCVQCNGSQDSNCNSSEGGLSISPSQCAAPTASNAFCYVKVVGSNLQRGCALSVKEQSSCLSNAECSLCQPENANTTSACNIYDLAYRSGSSGTPGGLLGLLLGLLGLLATQRWL